MEADTAHLGGIFPHSNSPPSSSEIQALLAVWADLVETDDQGLDVVFKVQQALRRTVGWLKLWTARIPKEERRWKGDVLSSGIDYVRHLSPWWPVSPSGVRPSIANDELGTTESSRLLLTDESSVEEGENRPDPPSSRQTPSRIDRRISLQDRVWISLRDKTFRYCCLACIGTIALTVYGIRIWISSGRQSPRQLLGLAVIRVIQWKGRSVFSLAKGVGESSPLASNATLHNATTHNATIRNAIIHNATIHST